MNGAMRDEVRRGEIVGRLKEVAGRVGPQISIARFQKETGIAHSVIYRLFDNWADLRSRAGLPAVARRDRSLYGREELIERLQEVAAIAGEDVSWSEWMRHTRISRAPIERLFGCGPRLNRPLV